MTDPAVFAVDAGAFRGVLIDSSAFGFAAFFGVALEADAGALDAVFFKEGATFDFAVAILVRRDGTVVLVSVLF